MTKNVARQNISDFLCNAAHVLDIYNFMAVNLKNPVSNIRHSKDKSDYKKINRTQGRVDLHKCKIINTYFHIYKNHTIPPAEGIIFIYF